MKQSPTCPEYPEILRIHIGDVLGVKTAVNGRLYGVACRAKDRDKEIALRDMEKRLHSEVAELV